MASDKVHHPLNKRDLKNFMDYDAAMSRVGHIAQKKLTLETQNLAKELIEAAKIGKDDLNSE